MIQHIIYFSANHIFIFQWQRKLLITRTTFSSSDEGLAEFQQYIQAHSDVAFKIMVDIYEEDYRREKIPNVRGKDRKSIIDRLMDRYYRDEKYLHTHRLSKSTSGRKDAQILLCALGENSLLESALSIMKDNQAIISGIWSLAIISNELIKLLSIDKSCTLLISQQTKSHQREMFFKGSDLYFSRKTAIDKNIGKLFFEKIKQTSKFITNQKMMGFNEKLNIVSIYDSDKKASISTSKDTSLAEHHRSYSIDDVIKKLSLKNCQGSIGATIFSYLCAKMPNSSNHYLANKDRGHYRYYFFNKAIRNFTAIGFLLLSAASLVLAITKNGIEKDNALLNDQYSLLQKEYTENYSEYAEYLSYSKPIESSVKIAYQIKESSKKTLFSYFLPISATFSNEQFSAISIDELHWKKRSKSDKARTELQLQGNANSQLASEYIEDMSLDESSTSLNTITLSGTITEPFAHYRDNVALINQWKNVLQLQAEINRVVIIDTPADVRPSRQFRDSIKNNSKESNSTPLSNNKYRYKILIDVSNNGRGEKNE